MKLPNGDRAVVDIAKLRDYCLSLQHSVGKHKAKVFLAALGLSASDAEDQYGQRYMVDFTIT